MYLQDDGHTYYRGTEQCRSRGAFLLLFSWNQYKASDEIRAACSVCKGLKATRATTIARVIADPIAHAGDRGAFDWPEVCPEHRNTQLDIPGPKYANGRPKLWACVRKVALHQCGHWMMGSARIAGARIPISGSCGADGLPRDLQEVPIAYRSQLVEVPEDVAAVYWSDNGHNTIGDAAPTVRDWAIATFLAKGGK